MEEIQSDDYPYIPLHGNIFGKKPTVTVITSTIGRPELRQCIESVRSQTYNVKHMVFVNGPKYHNSSKAILKYFPDIHCVYLPEETGAFNGSNPTCASVFAAAPLLTNSDWVFFLNDDDFYDSNHIESIMNMVIINDLKWAYSLRKFVTKAGELICDDNWSSLGHWPIHNTVQYVVDNSCFAVSRELAIRYGLAWTAYPILGDRYFLMALKESGEKAGCTGLSTVNYRIGTGSAPDEPEAYLKCAEIARSSISNGEGFPWRKQNIF